MRFGDLENTGIRGGGMGATAVYGDDSVIVAKASSVVSAEAAAQQQRVLEKINKAASDVERKDVKSPQSRSACMMSAAIVLGRVSLRPVFCGC